MPPLDLPLSPVIDSARIGVVRDRVLRLEEEFEHLQNRIGWAEELIDTLEESSEGVNRQFDELKSQIALQAAEITQQHRVQLALEKFVTSIATGVRKAYRTLRRLENKLNQDEWDTRLLQPED